MGLSRLDNFLKNVSGNILYVSPNDIDATDSIENLGNSPTRPFKTIQRALLESARFSYQRGLDNDRFGKTTIMLSPGDHIVDNRPGWIPDGANNFRLRNGTTSDNFPPLSLTSNFDLTSSDNELYKLNSIYGGVIVPRGTSIVGVDLRKTKIRPKYVPNPENDTIQRSAIFRLTGQCYFWQFSFLDADPNGVCFKDYTNNIFVPNFSHHKLSCFEYADGVNDVSINDEFLVYATNRTDLDIYYEKVGLAYGQSSGRSIEPDYPSSGIDIQAKIDEYRIVGPTGGEVGIASIRAGDGITASNIVTVTTSEVLPGIDVDTTFQISGITAVGYNGQFAVAEVLSPTQFQYQVQNAPGNPLPPTSGATVNLAVDTVTSASPYIFNVSTRSVFGMCGVLGDGNKAQGFKSMVIAQFTGISLQKDDNAFVKYDTVSGQYTDSTSSANIDLHSDINAIYKPEYVSFHIKAINDAYMQLVSVFAIGYAEQFSVDTGGDYSVTNSNSNFGAKALVARGFRRNAFAQDDKGYITHVVPPQEIENPETSIEFVSIDVQKTIGVGSTSRLYLYTFDNGDVPPTSSIEGYKIGARENDQLKVLISQAGITTEYDATIVMPNTQNNAVKASYVKSFNVGKKSDGIDNTIVNNIITLTAPHTFLTGETVRIIGSEGELPDGLLPNKVYYSIVSGVGIGSTQLKIAQTLNDAINGNEVTLNSKGVGTLRVESRVSDKSAGQIGHPIQWDTVNNNWYVTVSAASTENSIYSQIVGLGTIGLGEATPRTFFNRISDSRGLEDTLYKIRYVIPSDSQTTARPPLGGYIIQESNTSIGATDGEIQAFYSDAASVLSNSNQIRNFRFIANAVRTGTRVDFVTELPHDLKVGSEVEIQNVKSTINPVGVAQSGFNGNYVVTGISSTKCFSVGIITDPGSFTSDTTLRTTSLPYFKKKKTQGTFFIYAREEKQKYVANQQDGVYYLTVLNSSNKPSVEPFTDLAFTQPVQNLYPQTNRDNPASDPEAASSFALPNPIGQVAIDDPQNSITKETIEELISDNLISPGIGLTNIISNSAGTAHTIFTKIDHELNRLTRVSIANSGTNYGDDAVYYNAKLVSNGGITGHNATARVSISGGTISDIRIMDGGSAYGIGNTLAVVGIATTTSHTVGLVTVTSIYNNIGDILYVSGVSEGNTNYNSYYRITGIDTGIINKVEVETLSSVASASTTGIGSTALLQSQAILVGKSYSVTGLVYNPVTGLATVTTNQANGFQVNNKIIIGGASDELYNGGFIVKNTVGLTTFIANIGVNTYAPTVSGTIYAFPAAYTSQGGVISNENEATNGRIKPIYAGITTTLAATISATTDSIDISALNTLDFKIGDYILIDNEIMRIKRTVLESDLLTVLVFRGVRGTNATTHNIGSIIKKIDIKPIELRRTSLIRASNHTFEYLGFGPGNYSTALPQRQTRQLTKKEENLAHATEIEGGNCAFTAMNNDGDFYIGNKKINATSGREELFDTPIPSVTGQDITDEETGASLDIVTVSDVTAARTLKVDGGADNNSVSQFNGPVIFTNKITSNSDKGIEANSLFIQGDATVSRNYTVALAKPSTAGNPGDVAFYSDPVKAGYIGWVYTTNNDWYRFGPISFSNDSNVGIFDQVGIATDDPRDCKLRVGSGTTLFCVDANGVGIGTTANNYKLHVIGNTNIAGTCYANAFVGDGSGLTNLVNDSLWGYVTAGLGTGLYPFGLLNVGIGTSVPRYNLELGTPGTGSTDLYVNNVSIFNGSTFHQNVTISGILTTGNFDLDSTSGRITAGIITSRFLNVGTGGTVITTSGIGSVGIGITQPRANLDVNTRARFRSYYEGVVSATNTSGTVTIDLSQGQTFEIIVNAIISQFRIINAPPGATAFTIKVTQGSTPFSVNMDAFVNAGASTIPVYWSGGGVTPVVTNVANRTDIYSFMTFDSGVTFYGVIGGQNFA